MLRSHMASFDPIEKAKESVPGDLEHLIDSAVALDNFMVSELPLGRSRAGMYIYLNACVSVP
jgi:mediator of RNA polymerase II transcription subunit 5